MNKGKSKLIPLDSMHLTGQIPNESHRVATSDDIEVYTYLEIAREKGIVDELSLTYPYSKQHDGFSSSRPHRPLEQFPLPTLFSVTLFL